MMQSFLRVGSLLALMAFVVPNLNAQPQVGKKKEPDPYVKVGEVAGKIKSIEESTRSLTLTISSKQLDPGQVRNMQRAQYDLARARDARGRLSAQRRLIQAKAKLYKNVNKDVMVESLDDVKVRIATPPPTFDEKGNLVKPNKEKLKELKGPDPRVPGYMAEFTELRPDQIVKVTLVKSREALRRKPNPRGKDVDLELLQKENAPKISMILILGSTSGP